MAKCNSDDERTIKAFESLRDQLIEQLGAVKAVLRNSLADGIEELEHIAARLKKVDAKLKEHGSSRGDTSSRAPVIKLEDTTTFDLTAQDSESVDRNEAEPIVRQDAQHTSGSAASQQQLNQTLLPPENPSVSKPPPNIGSTRAMTRISQHHEAGEAQQATPTQAGTGVSPPLSTNTNGAHALLGNAVQNQILRPPAEWTQLNSALYPTVIFLKGEWCEISCQICGGNAGSDRHDKKKPSQFFSGALGLCNHVRAKHLEETLCHPRRNSNQNIVESTVFCTRRPISAEDARRVEAGEVPETLDNRIVPECGDQSAASSYRYMAREPQVKQTRRSTVTTPASASPKHNQGAREAVVPPQRILQMSAPTTNRYLPNQPADLSSTQAVARTPRNANIGSHNSPLTTKLNSPLYLRVSDPYPLAKIQKPGVTSSSQQPSSLPLRVTPAPLETSQTDLSKTSSLVGIAQKTVDRLPKSPSAAAPDSNKIAPPPVRPKTGDEGALQKENRALDKKRKAAGEASERPLVKTIIVEAEQYEIRKRRRLFGEARESCANMPDGHLHLPGNEHRSSDGQL